MRITSFVPAAAACLLLWGACAKTTAGEYLDECSDDGDCDADEVCDHGRCVEGRVDGSGGAGTGGTSTVGPAGPGPTSGPATTASTSTSGPASTSGPSSGPTSSATSGPSSGNSTAQATATSTGSGFAFCDDIGVCSGDGLDPSSGCIECAVIGDSSTATDGGTCADEYIACLGTDEFCSGGNPECCSFVDCLNTCPDPNIDPQGNLDCTCTNDGFSCLPIEEQMPGTCLGDNPAGLDDYLNVVTCMFNDTCPTSCAQ